MHHSRDFVFTHTCFFLRQGILWVQIRAVLCVYSPLVLLSATSNPVQTHTYRKKTQTQDINDATGTTPLKYTSVYICLGGFQI